MISGGCILWLYYGVFLYAKEQSLPSSVPVIFLITELPFSYKKGRMFLDTCLQCVHIRLKLSCQHLESDCGPRSNHNSLC